MKTQFLQFTMLLLVICSPNASAVLIDFESVGSTTVVRNEFVSQGLKISGAGVWSGRVQSTGDFGVADFGNSQTQWAHMGLRQEPTTLVFVDPTDDNLVIGATEFSVRVGDGNVDAETFSFTYFDIAGSQIGSAQTFTTFALGLTISATSQDLGSLIGSVKMELLANSASGVAFDDVQFTLSKIPEPGTLLLVGLGLLGVKWKKALG